MQSLCSAAGYWPSQTRHAQTLPGDEATAAQLPAWQPRSRQLLGDCQVLLRRLCSVQEAVDSRGPVFPASGSTSDTWLKTVPRILRGYLASHFEGLPWPDKNGQVLTRMWEIRL